MISNIYATSKYLNAHSVSGPNINNYGVLSAGQMRFNPSNGTIEAYDGYNWIGLSHQSSIELTPEAIELLDWAKQKKDEEAKFKLLIEKHPGIKELKEKLDVMTILATEGTL